jgi:hypothetical protein|tara:strand:- start:1331 stop:1660 length:330 start_codon:yes stop_codon:yes gene_type:complete
MEMHRWKIETMIKNFFLSIWSGIKAFCRWGWELDKKIVRKIWSVLKAIWLWIVGHPAELTYWFEGNEYIVHVRKFREIKPNHIMFKNIETDKHVAIKSDQPIKYIIREE